MWCCSALTSKPIVFCPSSFAGAGPAFAPPTAVSAVTGTARRAPRRSRGPRAQPVEAALWGGLACGPFPGTPAYAIWASSFSSSFAAR